MHVKKLQESDGLIFQRKLVLYNWSIGILIDEHFPNLLIIKMAINF